MHVSYLVLFFLRILFDVVADMAFFFFIWSSLLCIVLWSYSGNQRRKGKQMTVKPPSRERWMFLPGHLIINLSILVPPLIGYLNFG